MGSLDGRCALVTGSTKGIGFSTAERLLRDGASVVIHGQSAASVEAAIARLPGSAQVTPAPADLSSKEGCDLLLRKVNTEIDILVNNCGVFQAHSWLNVSPARWNWTLNVNALSGYYLTSAALPAMLSRGWGRCIFVSSETALCPPPQQLGPYAVTKAMQIVMTRLFAQEAAGRDVTVNAVIPGPTLTEGQEGVIRSTQVALGTSDRDAAIQRILATRPPSLLGRMATADEVAALVAYLASPASSATTGAIVPVDGGVSWRG
jgi:NAD(P)-dependent dehydrogenase (short-subunit alcohol dehydrogenase family)